MKIIKKKNITGKTEITNPLPFIQLQLDAIHLETQVKKLNKFVLGLTTYLIENEIIKEDALRDILAYANPPCTYASLKIVDEENNELSKEPN